MRYLVVLTIFFSCLAVSAQGIPNNLQAAIFYKVLAYDYNLQSTSEQDITIVIVVDSKSAKQQGSLEIGFKNLIGQKLGDKTLKVAVVSVKNASELETKITSVSGDILYVADGSAPETISKVLQIAESKKHPTLCGSESLAKQGFAIGLTVESGKPKIVINLAASQAQGMKLSSKVLRLAKVIK